MIQDYQGRKDVNVIAKPEELQTVPHLMRPIAVPILKFGCIHRGQMTYGAKVVDTQLARDRKLESSSLFIINQTI